MIIVGICRFSLVGRGDWRAYKSKDPSEGEAIAAQQAERLFRAERMEARFKTFEHLTLASLRAQTDQNFRFIVLASKLMPMSYQDRLTALCRQVPQISLHFFGVKNVGEAQHEAYRALKLKFARTIQFRLDDDDCVCVDFIEQLRAAATPMLASREPFAVSLDGVLYCATSTERPIAYHWPVKFFSAGAALKHNTKSIYRFGHFALGRRFRTNIINNRLSLASHGGANDTSLATQRSRLAKYGELTDSEIEERLEQNFPFLTATARKLVGLHGLDEMVEPPKSQVDSDRQLAPNWLTSLFSSKYRKGFYISHGRFSLQYTRREANVLYVGFDDLSRARSSIKLRDPWGYVFAEQRKWSSLGVQAYSQNWFRSPDLFEQLYRLRDGGFFEGYGKVVFSGTSMGGYAACAFSSLAPGSTVIAFSPQSTLDPKIVEWDARYPTGSRADWSGPFSDAANDLRLASDAWVIFDPALPEDQRHAQRLAAPNVKLLRAKYSDHFTAQFLRQIGILSTVVEDCVHGTMSATRFAQLYRTARDRRRYLLGVVRSVELSGGTHTGKLLRALESRGRQGLASKIRNKIRASSSTQPEN